jgi:hypothetical protein
MNDERSSKKLDALVAVRAAFESAWHRYREVLQTAETIHSDDAQIADDAFKAEVRAAWDAYALAVGFPGEPDHHHDAGEHEYGGVPANTVIVGERIKFRGEWERIEHVWHAGEKCSHGYMVEPGSVAFELEGGTCAIRALDEWVEVLP